MNYEEKYKQALERASKLRVQNPFDTVGQMVGHIFPELAESEDEKIKKEIIAIFKGEIPFTSEEDAKRYIAWLEKQGEPKDKESDDELTWLKTFIEEEAYYLSMDIRDEVDREKLIKLQNALAWLEKQGEQTHAELGQSEMTKTSDKELEPKFHPGDWVIDNFGNTYQIETATEIESEHIFGYTIVGGGYFNDNSNVRLWTIQDAKDGDVLATWAGAFIYNGNNDGSGCPGSYCGINTLGRFQIGGEKHWTGKKVYPATKEQRDLFFSKMKEAGWEWYGDKKELCYKYLSNYEI